MDKFNFVLAELKRRNGQLDKVAYRSNVSRRTIGNIMAGRDVRLSTITRLYKHLSRTAAE